MAPSDGVPSAASPDASLVAAGPAETSQAVPAPVIPSTPSAGPPSLAVYLFALLLTAGFGFLLASFPARNSDLWMHLAAGRRLIQGEILTGGHPHDAPNFWLSASWLYDLVSCVLYQWLGGAGLVFVKALLVAALGALLLHLSRAGPGWWGPSLCAMLALLAAAPRLLLQPAVVSFLLLAATLILLRRRAEKSASRPLAWLPSGPFAALFLLWANIDSAFVFGLGVVGATWLGEAVDHAVQRTKETRNVAAGARLFAVGLPRLLVSLGVLSALCLLNPSGIQVFAPGLEQLTLFGASRSLAPASPFRRGYWAAAGLNPATLAYFPLLGLGLISFILTLPRWHWRRFLPWIGLALASAVQARLIPLFAVVAGPMLAWNFTERSARSGAGTASAASRRTLALVGSVAAAALELVLLACAWPGWLQAPPFEPRSWAVETSPSVQRGAEAVRQWHRDARLSAQTRGLHLSADTAEAFAWFCPEERGVLDAGLSSDILSARAGWAAQLRKAGVTHLIVYESDRGEPDRGRLFDVLSVLLANSKQWPLLYEGGDLAVFGWRDPEGVANDDPFRGMEVDVNQRAYQPSPNEKAPPRPAARPAERPWWTAFWQPLPDDPFDREEATMRLLHAEVLRRLVGPKQLIGWVGSQAAALVGGAAGWSGPADLYDARVRATIAVMPPAPANVSLEAVPPPERWAYILQSAFAFEQDDIPPASLYLAVRAARRAVSVNPDDDRAWEVLGESYLRLVRNTRERAWARLLPQIIQLRYAQASTALNQAIALRPDYAEAHFQLGGLYQEMGYYDLSLQHMQTYLALLHAAGPPAGMDPKDFRAQEAAYQTAVDALAKQVKDLDAEYTVQAAGKRVLDRAELAMDKHLAGKALAMLLESDITAFGKDGTMLELGLLLTTGRPKDVADWTGPDLRNLLEDANTYYWFRARARAATGDYAGAEEEIAAMAPSSKLSDKVPAGTSAEELALLVGRRVLSEAPGAGPPYALRWPFGMAEYNEGMGRVTDRIRSEANMTVMWGLLALEQGEVGDAKFAFKKAVNVWRDEATAASGAGIDFQGRSIAQIWLKRLDEAAPP